MAEPTITVYSYHSGGDGRFHKQMAEPKPSKDCTHLTISFDAPNGLDRGRAMDVTQSLEFMETWAAHMRQRIAARQRWAVQHLLEKLEEQLSKSQLEDLHIWIDSVREWFGITKTEEEES